MAAGARLLLLRAVAAAAAALPPGSDAGALDAVSTQHLAAMVDAAAAMAAASEQLVATEQSLLMDAQLRPDLPPFEELRLLGGVNQELRALLQRLHGELGVLFVTGRSDGLRPLLGELSGLPAARRAAVDGAVASLPLWTHLCRAPAAAARYRHFEALYAEHGALEADLRNLSAALYGLREESVRADGTLAGLEERLGRRRARRRGEEYGLARHLGSSLFRWDILRTKVAHHLAVAFTEAKEEAGAAPAPDGGGAWEAAERGLDTAEERLLHAATAHKELAESQASLGKKVRAFLKSLLLSCDADAGPEGGAAISGRFRVLTGKRLGVAVQATEELARFLNRTLADTLPRSAGLLERLLAPYAAYTGGPLLLPQTWKPKPKVGRWWEWLGARRGGGAAGAGGHPLRQEEFERRFAAAKRRFSVRVSAAEPVVMVYILWLLLDDTFGSAAPGEGPQEVLALPSPADAAQIEMPGAAQSTIV